MGRRGRKGGRTAVPLRASLRSIPGLLQLRALDTRFPGLVWDSESRKRRRRGSSGGHDDTVLHDGVPVPAKYWLKRALLWPNFDGGGGGNSGGGGGGGGGSGIVMDLEGWFSVTPAAAAEGIAARMLPPRLPSLGDATPGVGGVAVLDLFCGCGGNTVAFARHPDVALVVAVDCDAARLAMARHNAGVCGVAHKVVWVHGDAVALLLGALCGGARAHEPAAAPAHSAPTNGGFLRGDDVRITRTPTGGLEVALHPQPGPPPPAMVASRVRVGAVFLAPPWGGVHYSALHAFHPTRDLRILSPAAAALAAEVAARTGWEGAPRRLGGSLDAAAACGGSEAGRAGNGGDDGCADGELLVVASALVAGGGAGDEACCVGVYLPRNTDEHALQGVLERAAAATRSVSGAAWGGKGAGATGGEPLFAVWEHLSIGQHDKPLARLLYLGRDVAAQAGREGAWDA